MKTYYIVMAVVIAAMTGGCGNNHSHGTDAHDHAHDETLQLTAYSADFEVFAEATPFVAGQPSEILAHFSFLKDFKPITEGKIIISLIVGTDGIRQTLNEPTRQGIYLFRLTPAIAGTGRIIFDIETSAGKSQIVMPNITVYTNEHDAHEAATDAAATSVNGAVFTKEQSWKVDFATDVARREPFGQVIRTTAQIQPSQGDQRIVATQTGGVAIFPNENIVEGKAVNAGQTLFTIDASGMADNNLAVRLAEAESEYIRAKAKSYPRRVTNG